jgi:hypothetical protein
METKSAPTPPLEPGHRAQLHPPPPPPLPPPAAEHAGEPSPGVLERELQFVPTLHDAEVNTNG